MPVMFDGTRQKRRHKSHNGVSTVVSLDTGLCLDFQILSNYCLACSILKDIGDDEEAWQAFHRPVCEKNTDYSSHTMEPAAAVQIWQCVRHKCMVTAIKKEECTNHVSKRLGTALWKLATPLPRGEKPRIQLYRNHRRTIRWPTQATKAVSEACTLSEACTHIFIAVPAMVPAVTTFALQD